MKAVARAVGMALFALATGCGSLMQAPDQGYEPPGADVPLVRVPLDDEAQRLVSRARDSLARDNPGRVRDYLARIDGRYRYEPDVLLVHGMVDRMTEQPQKAMVHYETLLQVEPTHPGAANDLALLYREEGRIQEAKGLLSTALEAHPDRPRLHYNLAVLYELYLVDLEQALVHYREYQAHSDGEDEKVARWIKDLERRVE
ncbi:tetratricopeptide repeat protein [Halospina denitrificans]|uniref:Tetratricopeptide repeat protein n=1 Tax=Halospina denitrificans TaxID=332522 RepID=A0A4R7JIF7_9GAMM|nr:tetratricopeptide repeat protein [Halospina denitrificans]TDT37086.1 tetratricopeptide repeat protein [Halospina denitrificans]